MSDSLGRTGCTVTHANSTAELTNGSLAEGMLLLESPYSASLIRRWNQILDPLFEGRQDEFPLAHVHCAELDGLGILDELLTPPIRSLVRAITPDAVIYHCYAWESPAGQRVPHASKTDAGGWHSDWDARHGLTSPRTEYWTLMIYLTDVPRPDYGAFEGLLTPQDGDATAGQPTRRMVGEAGTAWLFDRCAMHRVHPNRGAVRRRVIKLSFQSNQLPNHHLDEGRFSDTLQQIEAREDSYLQYLFGAQHPTIGDQTTLPDPHCPPVQTLRPRSNSTYLVTRRDRTEAAYYRAVSRRWGLDLAIRRAQGARRRARVLLRL
jgi:hypothetical protein